MPLKGPEAFGHRDKHRIDAKFMKAFHSLLANHGRKANSQVTGSEEFCVGVVIARGGCLATM